MRTNLLPLLLLVTLLTGCGPSKPPIFTQNVGYVDYYSTGLNGKILITESNSVSFDYIALGSIVVDESPGYESISAVTKTKEVLTDDELYGAKRQKKKIVKYETGEWRSASLSSALKAAVATADAMGGDAIINLHYEPIRVYNESAARYINRGIRVSGMVVKRK